MKFRVKTFELKWEVHSVDQKLLTPARLRSFWCFYWCLCWCKISAQTLHWLLILRCLWLNLKLFSVTFVYLQPGDKELQLKDTDTHTWLETYTTQRACFPWRRIKQTSHTNENRIKVIKSNYLMRMPQSKDTSYIFSISIISFPLPTFVGFLCMFVLCVLVLCVCVSVSGFLFKVWHVGLRAYLPVRCLKGNQTINPLL